MKKGLKIAGIVIGLLLIFLIATPFLFKDKIKEAVIKVANDRLDARLAVGDFGLNLFSNFPDATLSLNDVSLSGVDGFEGDTLLKAKSASATINLKTLFGGKYEISKIVLDNASVHARMMKDERANWDIVKDTTTSEEDNPFSLSLKKVEIKSGNIIYDDQLSDMRVVLKNWNGELSGDMDADETTLKTQSVIDEVSFVMDGIPYLSRVKGTVNASLKADLKNMKFTFEESDLQLNEIKTHVDGSVAMVGESGMDFDLKLNAPDTQFKDILSIIPSIYSQDFKDIKTAGTVSLDAYLKGLMDEENYPAFDVKLIVQDAMFQYPSLPKAVNQINIAVAVTNKGGSLDNTVVDVSKFTFNMGGNPFSASMNLQTPMSDPAIRLHVNGTVNLGMIKDVYPLEQQTELNGKLAADMNLSTRLSYIEKEQYENVTASGKLSVTDMVYKSSGKPDVMINDAGLEFSPKYVNLSSLNVKIGQNDLSATGRLENFIAYALKDQTLKGQLNLKSTYFDTNDFMGGEEEGAATADTASVGVFEVPQNIDFALNASMDKVIYENITLTGVNGAIAVRNGAITLKDIAANALGGTCRLNGSYSTAANPDKPEVDIQMSLNKVSFAETFKSVEAVQKFAPVFDKISGNYSMNLNFNTTLGESLMQILGALTGDGLIRTDEVQIEGVEMLDKLSTALKLGNTTSLKSFSTRDLNIPFKVENGQVITKPFNVNIGNQGKLNLEGSTGLDQSINYKGTVTLPKSASNKLVNNVGLTITGTFSNPSINIDTKSLLDDAAGSAINQLLGGNSEDGKGLGETLSEEKIKQAQRLRTDAQAASDKLVEAAKEQSQKLVDAAKNPLAKAAAQAGADKLVKEAEKQGQRLIDEAEVQAKKLEGDGTAASE